MRAIFLEGLSVPTSVHLEGRKWEGEGVLEVVGEGGHQEQDEVVLFSGQRLYGNNPPLPLGRPLRLVVFPSWGRLGNGLMKMQQDPRTVLLLSA